MSLELSLRFPEHNKVIIKFDDEETDTLQFTSPFSTEDHEDIRWYLEVYATRYTTDVDDARAERIANKLPQWAEALFNAVFTSRAAQRIFNAFQDESSPGRLLTISASHPEILSLPWELLRDPEGTYLVHENPRISIRRRLAGAGGGRRQLKVEPKESLHLLFVISRPSDAKFIDHRGEATAILDAIAQEAAGQVEVEFLRPATLDNLVARLEDRHKPPIDIVHFDGHGLFDRDGQFLERAKLSDPLAVTKGSNDNSGNTGYLLFEDKEGKQALISAETLGDMLNRQKVGLIVLSACQSAAVSGEDAMGCVAARLTHVGIPAVLAMTHSVLVTSTRQLFGKFYQHLVRGEGIGEALDNARRDLYFNRERGKRQRGDKQITLKLDDWFLPALYQAGKDTGLLTGRVGEGKQSQEIPSAHSQTNLPQLQEAGFFGRSRELWDIERWFVQGTRRLTISGFGGQGKTYLAAETGRWLYRTGMFDKVCFVDYVAFQGIDAIGLATSTLGAVLNRSLVDVAAATAVLQGTRTLLILDNLESLQPQALKELLTVAKQWSELGETRVLLTSRTPDFAHPDYPIEGSRKHISMHLQKLGQEDALAYFQSLMKLPPVPLFDPPERDVLLRLFQLVDFHPLSIGLIAKQLKTRRVAELGERLEALVTETPNNPLLASLNLSLEQLDEEARQLLPRLGIFQGGGFEDDLLAVTEFSESQWQKLRLALENTGLIQPKIIPNLRVPYLKFHPTLAPVLQARLSKDLQAELLFRYRKRYYQLSSHLYDKDSQNPYYARVIAKWELPNLLFAVYNALDTNEEWAVDFVCYVNLFLAAFDLNHEYSYLSQRAEQISEKLSSQTWYETKTNTGEQLFNARLYQKAAQVFVEVLTRLGEQPSFNRCFILGKLGQCSLFQKKVGQAVKIYQQALAVAEQLEPSKPVKQQIAALLFDLAQAWKDMGNYHEALVSCEKALALIKEFGGNPRLEATINFLLGDIAMLQGNVQKVAQHHQKAAKIFFTLKEPELIAVALQKLGKAYGLAKQWDIADMKLREATRISESVGNLEQAAGIWSNIAFVNKSNGKIEEAEAWYYKALNCFKALDDKVSISKILVDIANLLQYQPERLQEAQKLAQEALAIEENLDPAASKIWRTYEILAEIADKQQDISKAMEYRRLARNAKAGFAGTWYELQKSGKQIAKVVVAVNDPELRQLLEAEMDNAHISRHNFVTAIRRVLNGERDEDVLCKELDVDDSMIIYAILRGVANPQTLEELLGD